MEAGHVEAARGIIPHIAGLSWIRVGSEVVGPPPPVADVMRNPLRLAVVERLVAGIARDVEAELDRLTRLTAEMLHAPIVTLSLLAADHERIVGAAGLPEPYATSRQMPLSNSLSAFTVAVGAPLVIRDARRHAWTHDHEATREPGFGSYCGVPLLDANGRAFGALAAMQTGARTWSPEHLHILSRIAEFASDVLARVARETMIACLLDVQTRLAQIVWTPELSWSEAARQALAIIGTACQADMCAIWSFDETTGLLCNRAAWARPGSGVEHETARLRTVARLPYEGVAGAIYMARKPLWVSDLVTSTRISRTTLAREMDLRSAFGFPVTLGEAQVAVATFLSRPPREEVPEVRHAAPLWGALLGQLYAHERASAALASAHARTHAVMSVVPDAVILLGADHRIHEWNTGAEWLFGYARAEVLGKDFMALVVPPHLRARYMTCLAHPFESGQPSKRAQRTMAPIMTRGGEQIDVTISLAAVPQSTPPLFAVHLCRALVPQASVAPLPDEQAGP